MRIERAAVATGASFADAQPSRKTITVRWEEGVQIEYRLIEFE
ncbi:hypothetical protein [Sphingomicrobium nitratireducens]|nr:hypothetical protein [Sphingomicrobium nitratireducens]